MDLTQQLQLTYLDKGARCREFCFHEAEGESIRDPSLSAGAAQHGCFPRPRYELADIALKLLPDKVQRNQSLLSPTQKPNCQRNYSRENTSKCHVSGCD